MRKLDQYRTMIEVDVRLKKVRAAFEQLAKTFDDGVEAGMEIPVDALMAGLDSVIATGVELLLMVQPPPEERKAGKAAKKGGRPARTYPYPDRGQLTRAEIRDLHPEIKEQTLTWRLNEFKAGKWTMDEVINGRPEDARSTAAAAAAVTGTARTLSGWGAR